jgi:hypothetical protein
MHPGMGSAWPAPRQQGFALAAAAHDDRAAERAFPGLARDVADEAVAHARQLAKQDRAARRRWLRTVLSARPVLAPDDSAPPRALALLANDVPRDVGRRWLAVAPAPRAGYVPDPRLLALLRASCARHDGPQDDERGAR